MLDMETLGYFLYMEECDQQEEEEKLQHLKVNVENNDNLVPERATIEQNKRFY